MGDRNYYPNQPNPFIAQNYGYGQSPPQQQPLTSLFDMRSSPHGVGFSVKTNMPVYNTGDQYSRAQNSGMLHAQSQQSTEFCEDVPPPSYEESRNDTLLSRSGRSTKYSPAWKYITDEQPSEKRSFAQFFDIPGELECGLKSSRLSIDNSNPIQSFQRDSKRISNPHSSQQSPTNFSSDYGRQSNYRSSQDSGSSGRQNSDYNQNYNRGVGNQNKNRGGVRGRFRGRGDQQEGGRSRGRGWQGYGGFGGQNTSNASRGSSYQMGDRSHSGEYIDNRNIRGTNVEFREQERGSDGGGNGEDVYGGEEDHGDTEKVNVFVPDLSIIKKYEYFPPSPEEMGEMFKDLVIYFFFKIPKNKKEENPFVVVCESFRRSTGYANVEVEDGYDMKFKDRKFCTLRYQGMMLVRGIGENNCLKEPRVLAGIELINQLAMSCYTLEAKPQYFNVEAFKRMLEQGDVPGLYCFVPPEEAYDFNSASNYLKIKFSQEKDSDVEYIVRLPNRQEANALKSWANQHNPRYQARVIKDEWIGICRFRTTQYWRDKILASGSMETPKFILKPPQGIGNLLIPNFNIKQAVPKLQTRPYRSDCKLTHVYGPPGVGPNVCKALPPWERRGGSKKTRMGRKKEMKIMQAVQQGVPLAETKEYRYLSKYKKKKLKAKFGKGN